jgi:hypothetical protein
VSTADVFRNVESKWKEQHLTPSGSCCVLFIHKASLTNYYERNGNKKLLVSVVLIETNTRECWLTLQRKVSEVLTPAERGNDAYSEDL